MVPSVLHCMTLDREMHVLISPPPLWNLARSFIPRCRNLPGWFLYISTKRMAVEVKPKEAVCHRVIWFEVLYCVYLLLDSSERARWYAQEDGASLHPMYQAQRNKETQRLGRKQVGATSLTQHGKGLWKGCIRCLQPTSVQCSATHCILYVFVRKGELKTSQSGLMHACGM